MSIGSLYSTQRLPTLLCILLTHPTNQALIEADLLVYHTTSWTIIVSGVLLSLLSLLACTKPFYASNFEICKKTHTPFRPLLATSHAFSEFTRFVIHDLALFVFFSNICVLTSLKLFVCLLLLSPLYAHVDAYTSSVLLPQTSIWLKNLEIRLYPLTIN